MDVVEGDPAQEPAFRVHHGQGCDVVLSEDLRHLLLVHVGRHPAGHRVNEPRDRGVLVGDHQILQVHDPVEHPVLVHRIDFQDVGHLLAGLPDGDDGFPNGLVGADLAHLALHDAAGAVLRVGQKALDLRPVLGGKPFQDRLGFRLGQIGEQVRRIVRFELLHRLDQPFDLQLVADGLQLFLVQVGQHLRQPCRTQTAGDLRPVLLVHVIEQLGDVRRVQELQIGRQGALRARFEEDVDVLVRHGSIRFASVPSGWFTPPGRG